MKINILVIVFFLFLCLSHFNSRLCGVVGGVNAQSLTASTNITTLLEMKGLYTNVLIDSKVKLGDIEKAKTIKQSELNILLTAYESLSEEEKVDASIQIKTAQKQLDTINSVSKALQLKLKSTNVAISKLDSNITSILGGANPSLLRFSIIASGGGGDGMLVVKENSDIYGIGANPYGNAGCGNFVSTLTSACQTINNGVLKGKFVWQIKSQFQTVILTTDNTLISFGYGSALGTGATANSNVPVLVQNSLFADKQIKHLEVGWGSSIIMTTDGQMYGWGNNAFGELCSSGSKLTPTLLPTFTKKFKRVFYQSFSSIFLTEDGEVYGCGRFDLANVVFYSTYTKLDVSTIDPNDPIEDVAIGHAFIIFKTKYGKLYSMGYGGSGSLGLGDTVNRNTPTLISYFKNANIVITKVCAGQRHVLALSSSGKIFQWGTPTLLSGMGCETSYAASEMQSSTTPFRFLGNDIENHKIIDIYCGGATSVAVSETGVAFGWGRSQLFGTGTTAAVPTKLTLP